MATEATKFTRDDYMRLPEGFPAELIEGELVREPAPTYDHQRTVQEVFVRLHGLLGPARVVVSPIDVFVDRYNVLQPDVLVLAKPLPREVPEVGIPVLVVEVLSPSTAFRDRRQKRRIYLASGVEEVWIVDPETETIAVHTRKGSTEYGLDETATSAAVPGVELTPREILRD